MVSDEPTQAGTLAPQSEHPPATDRQRPPPRGTSLGRYVVLHELGRGGMGVVLAAYDPELDRKVAIKLLRGPGSHASERRSLRLRREAQAMARVAHPNVVTVHDVGVHGGQLYLAMELVDGETLAAWLQPEARS